MKRIGLFLLATTVGISTASFPVYAASEYRNGTYTGTGTGYGGDVKLEVSIDNSKITAIEVVSQNETPSYWKKASALFDKIIGAQSVEVDCISGATKSSNGIKQAVADALSQAELTADNQIFAGGKGTEENPYQIATEQQLRAFSNAVDTGTTFTGKYIALTADITMGEENFEPIGEGYTSCFAGTFDGKEHTISGLTIHQDNITEDTKAGLFDTLSASAVVDNVNLADVDISLSGNSALYAGGIAADTKAGDADTHPVINYCTVTGAITANTSGAKLCYAGGIVGRMFTNAYVTNSGAEVTVAATSSDGNNSAYAGGITGMGSKDSVIANCYAVGKIGAFSPKSSNFGGMAGGIAAMYAGKQYNVYTDCDIEVNNNKSVHQWIGGINGQLTAAVLENYAVYGYYTTDASQKINGTALPMTQAVGVPGTSLKVGVSSEFAGCSKESMKSDDFAEKMNSNIVSEKKIANSLSVNDIKWNEWSYSKEKQRIVINNKEYISDKISTDIFADGSGTVEDPYIISNAEQLRAFAGSLNERIDYSGKTIALSADIDVSDAAWSPIGGSDYLFNGTFEGNNYVIRGMHLGSSEENYVLSSDELYIGLFGLLGENARVQNLGIEDVAFYIKNDASAYVGTLAGYNNGAIIDSCYATGSVSADAGKGNNFAGGLVSYMYKGAVINSYTDVSVSCITTDGIAEAGGIAALNNRGLVANCYTLGNSYGSADRAKEGMACVAGIVAVEAGTQVNCAAYGNITTGEYSYYAGMLSGWVTGIGKVYQCYYNSDAIMKIGEQTPNPIVDIGTMIEPGVNDEGESYRGSMVAMNEAMSSQEMKSGMLAEKLNANAWTFAANVTAWNLKNTALKAFAYTKGSNHVTLSNESLTVTYVQPEIEKEIEPEVIWTDGTYYGRDSHKTLVVKIQISSGKLADITCISGAVDNEETLKAQIIEQQKVTGTSAYEEAVSKALEKMLAGDTTDYANLDTAAFDGGDGSVNNPYLISTQEQLAYLADSLNENTTYQGLYFALTKDISLSGEWKPIGTAKYPFKGNFNGNGHTISGVTIGNSNAPASYELCGLFGYCNGLASNGEQVGVTIQNIKLENVSIFNQNTGRSYAGALVGAADYGVQIKNCSAQGTISNKSVEKMACAGGLVGQHLRGLMTNSSANVKVEVVSGKNWVYGGGLLAMTNRATIINCYSIGNVTGTAGAANKSDIGGLIGMSGGVTVNCFATGDAVSMTPTGDVGGLCGRLTGIAVLYNSYYSTDSLQKNGNTTNQINVSCGTNVAGSKEEAVEGKQLTVINSTDFVKQLNQNVVNVGNIMQSVDQHLQGLDLEHKSYYDGSALNNWGLKDGRIVLGADVPKDNMSGDEQPKDNEPSDEQPKDNEPSDEQPKDDISQDDAVGKIDLNDARVSGIVKKYYTGKALKQSDAIVAVKDTVLKKGTDYTVSYKNNKNIGTATVTFTGKGKYTGEIQKTFKITVKKGTTYTVDNMEYKITNAATNGKGTVSLCGTTKRKADKKMNALTVASTVKIGGKNFKITAINKQAFKGYKYIKRVTVGDNVSVIEKEAFSGCAGLKTITLGKGITKIKEKAFYNCKNLKSITIKSSKLTSVGKNAIGNIHSKATIKVPSKKLKTYKKYFNSKAGYKKTMMLTKQK